MAHFYLVEIDADLCVEPLKLLGIGSPALRDLRFVLVEYRELGEASRESCVSKSWFERYGSIQAGNRRLAVGASPDQNEGELEVCVREVRVELERAPIPCYGFRPGRLSCSNALPRLYQTATS